ncbi:hypothetical protein CC80DRAFT_563107, partial [Byssothecium circinans]
STKSYLSPSSLLSTQVLPHSFHNALLTTYSKRFSIVHRPSSIAKMRVTNIISILLASALGALAVPSPVVLGGSGQLIKNEAAPIPVPTLMPMSAAELSLLKRDENDGMTFLGHCNVKTHGQTIIRLNEPIKGGPYCFFLDEDKEHSAGTKYSVFEGNICYFYEKPCDPGQGYADYHIGTDNTTWFDFNKDGYVAYGCEKWNQPKPSSS